MIGGKSYMRLTVVAALVVAFGGIWTTAATAGVSPAVAAMRGLEAQRVAASAQARTAIDANDLAGACPALDAVMTLTEREHDLMPDYMAASDSDDTPMGDREAHKAAIDKAMADGPDVWAQLCAGDYPDKTHATWDDANTDFQAELVEMQRVATDAYTAEDNQQHDQVCVPLRHSIAILIHVRRRIDEMDRLAAGDSAARDRDVTYRNAIADTMGKITPDGAELCDGGAYRTPMVERMVNGHTLMIPQSLADQLAAHEEKRQEYGDRYLRFKDELDKDMDSEVQSNICADVNIMWESQQNEISEYETMAELSKAYPDLAASYEAAIKVINDANYGIGAPTCGS